MSSDSFKLDLNRSRHIFQSPKAALDSASKHMQMLSPFQSNGKDYFKRCKSSQGNFNDPTAGTSRLRAHSPHEQRSVTNLLQVDDKENSFDISRAVVDAYPEYCMLKKLQQLTSHFFCNSCKHSLDFAGFFSETHDCIFEEKDEAMTEIAMRNEEAHYQDTLVLEHNDSSVVLEDEETKSPP